MQADALHYRAMTLLAEFHRREGWKGTGFSSTADWLAWRVSIKPGAARERVRTALALEELPETSRAMANGELSFTKVRALTRVATSQNEDAFLELARSGSAANLERVVRAWKQLDRRSEVDAEQLRYRSRRASAFVGDDGMVVVRARLDPEAGAMFMRAVEIAADALFKGDPDEDPARRRADAVGLIAERALAAGFAPDDDAPVSGSRVDRTQVVLHVEECTLTEDQEPGRSELEDGTRVSSETSRRVACDTGVVRMTRDQNGNPLTARRRTRTVPPALRRALEARDRGCRFPGCGLRFTDAHHVERVCMDRDQKVVFFTPQGALLAHSPRHRGNVGYKPRATSHSPRPAGRDGAAKHKRDSSVPWSVEAQALEALEGGGPAP